MKRISPFAAAALAAVLAVPALAASPMELAKAKNCLNCHAIDHKIVGPAYRDVAKKYRGQKGIVAKLAAKVQHGGAGVWGSILMPPNRITDAEAKELVTWVLSQ